MTGLRKVGPKWVASAMVALCLAAAGCNSGGESVATGDVKADLDTAGYVKTYALTGTVQQIESLTGQPPADAVVVATQEPRTLVVIGQAKALDGTPPIKSDGTIAFVLESANRFAGFYGGVNETLGKPFELTLYRKGDEGGPLWLEIEPTY